MRGDKIDSIGERIWAKYWQIKFDFMLLWDFAQKRLFISESLKSKKGFWGVRPA